MNLAHPFRISFGKVIIDRDNMNALSFQRIQIRRQRGYQRFTFTGLHLGNSSLMKNNTADQLYPVMFHAKHTKSRFPDNRKSFRKQIIQCFSLLQTFFKNTGPAAKFFIGKLRHHRFKSFNLVHNRINPFQFSLAVSSQNF